MFIFLAEGNLVVVVRGGSWSSVGIEYFLMDSNFAIDVRGVTKKFGARTVVNNTVVGELFIRNQRPKP